MRTRDEIPAIIIGGNAINAGRRQHGIQQKVRVALIDRNRWKLLFRFGMKTRLAALPVVTTVAVFLAGPITNVRAIGVQVPSGKVVELGSLSGVVSHVNLNKHTFTLKWQHKGNLAMEHYYPSYQQEYRVTDGTVYKNGAWTTLQNGARIRIVGHSFVATEVQFLGPPRTFNAEVFSH
jgi:hypothetical protein